jgi:hypothetical protein
VIVGYVDHALGARRDISEAAHAGESDRAGWFRHAVVSAKARDVSRQLADDEELAVARNRQPRRRRGRGQPSDLAQGGIELHQSASPPQEPDDLRRPRTPGLGVANGVRVGTERGVGRRPVQEVRSRSRSVLEVAQLIEWIDETWGAAA